MKIVNIQTHEDTELFNLPKAQAGALLICKDLCSIGFAVWHTQTRLSQYERSRILRKLKIYVEKKRGGGGKEIFFFSKIARVSLQKHCSVY